LQDLRERDNIARNSVLPSSGALIRRRLLHEDVLGTGGSSRHRSGGTAAVGDRQRHLLHPPKGSGASSVPPDRVCNGARSPRLTDSAPKWVCASRWNLRYPGAGSHGCSRIRNSDILRLARFMPIGNPVIVR
jgi:hypothetical protein